MTLLEPTDKYTHYILNSWNYLGKPKAMYNEAIHSLVRGYSIAEAKENLRTFFKQYNDSKALKMIDGIVTSFKGISWQELLKINPEYDTLPEHVLLIQKKVSDWHDNQMKIINSYHPNFRNRAPQYKEYPFKFGK